MYFWNVRALADDLKLERVTPKEKTKYFLVQTVIASIILSYAYNFPNESPTYNTDVMAWGEIIITTLINFSGIWLCYEANELGDNKEFLDRVICLSWPIGIRLTILTVPLYIMGYVITDQLHIAEAAQDVFGLVANSGILLIFYTWVRSYLLDISNAKDHSTITNPPSI